MSTHEKYSQAWPLFPGAVVAHRWQAAMGPALEIMGPKGGVEVTGVDAVEAIQVAAAFALSNVDDEEVGELYQRLHSLSKSLESSGRIDEMDNQDAYATILDTMAFVARLRR